MVEIERATVEKEKDKRVKLCEREEVHVCSARELHTRCYNSTPI